MVSNIFFSPLFREDEPILTFIFFRWVGSTTNQLSICLHDKSYQFFPFQASFDESPRCGGQGDRFVRAVDGGNKKMTSTHGSSDETTNGIFHTVYGC